MRRSTQRTDSVNDTPSSANGVSMAAGLAGALGGLVMAYHLNVPCGAAIVLMCIGLFIVTLVAGRLRARAASQTITAR